MATACVKPYATPMARDLLEGSGVGVCAVIAFPHGNSTTAIKAREAEEAVGIGAMEIDMVANIGKVRSREWDSYVSAEIGAVNEVVVSHHALLKVIFENDYLEDSHILKLCELCAVRHVAFVKTSTGYGFVRQANGLYAYAGATDHHLQLIRGALSTLDGGEGGRWDTHLGRSPACPAIGCDSNRGHRYRGHSGRGEASRFCVGRGLSLRGVESWRSDRTSLPRKVHDTRGWDSKTAFLDSDSVSAIGTDHLSMNHEAVRGVGLVGLLPAGSGQDCDQTAWIRPIRGKW